MLLIDYAREAGCACGSIASPGHGLRHVGWTTDEVLAEKLRSAGATVITGYGADDRNPGVPTGSYPKSKDTPMGWEISFLQGTQVRLETVAA
ncbi:MAG TPA: hypothetical protein VFY10_11575 [Dehalococcoidia bacterium]|nr:hypothetical protein [Dehalococcoidia bacterium]